jgi:hypothetical protein
MGLDPYQANFDVSPCVESILIEVHSICEFLKQHVASNVPHNSKHGMNLNLNDPPSWPQITMIATLLMFQFFSNIQLLCMLVSRRLRKHEALFFPESPAIGVSVRWSVLTISFANCIDLDFNGFWSTWSQSKFVFQMSYNKIFTAIITNTAQPAASNVLAMATTTNCFVGCLVFVSSKLVLSVKSSYSKVQKIPILLL